VSFGGLVAYEIAQLLISQGHKVNFLGLLDTYYPHQNSAYKPSLQKRMSRHILKIKREGISHISKRIKWRSEAMKNYVRYVLYKIDWVRDNFADQTSRNFALTQYMEEKKEQKKLNENYTIQPYQGVTVPELYTIMRVSVSIWFSGNRDGADKHSRLALIASVR